MYITRLQINLEVIQVAKNQYQYQYQYQYQNYLESVLEELRELEENLANNALPEKTKQFLRQNFLLWYIMEADEIVSAIDFSKFPELNKVLKESEKEIQVMKSVIDQATTEETDDTAIIDVIKLFEQLKDKNDNSNSNSTSNNNK